MANLRIDVVSDGICPWCCVAKRLLERSLADVRGLEPHRAIVRWHPFPLPGPREVRSFRRVFERALEKADRA